MPSEQPIGRKKSIFKKDGPMSLSANVSCGKISIYVVDLVKFKTRTRVVSVCNLRERDLRLWRD